MKILEKSHNDSVNSIGKGSVLEGSIHAPGDIRVDGVLKGKLTAKGRLVLGQGGSIEGEVDCGSAVISGALKANIQSKELLVLKETAKLYGDIKTEKLSIDPGAMFSGKGSMGPINKPPPVETKHSIKEKKNELVEKKADKKNDAKI